MYKKILYTILLSFILAIPVSAFDGISVDWWQEGIQGSEVLSPLDDFDVSFNNVIIRGTLTFSGTMASDLDMDGNDILNADVISGVTDENLDIASLGTGALFLTSGSGIVWSLDSVSIDLDSPSTDTLVIEHGDISNPATDGYGINTTAYYGDVTSESAISGKIVSSVGLSAGQFNNAIVGAFTGHASDAVGSYMGIYGTSGSDKNGGGTSVSLLVDSSVVAGNDQLDYTVTAVNDRIKIQPITVSGEGQNVYLSGSAFGGGGSVNGNTFLGHNGTTAIGNVGIGTIDLDGTPAIGKLVVKGTTNDGSTNVFVGRDSDEANVMLANTDGSFYAGLSAPSVTGYTQARVIGSHSTTSTNISNYYVGVFAEAASDADKFGVGFYSVGMTSATKDGYGNVGIGKVADTADAGVAYGGYYVSVGAHSGGDNISLFSQASGASGAFSNYSFYGEAGEMYNEDKLVLKATTNDGTTDIINGLDSSDVEMFAIDSDGNMDLKGNLNIAGSINPYSEAVADDGYIDLPDATTGWGTVFIGKDLKADFSWDADGTVLIDISDGAVVGTDTDTNLCIFDNGTTVRIRNRLGSTQTIKLVTYY